MIIIIIAIFIFGVGLILLFLIIKQEQKFGVLTEERIYADSKRSPGKLLYSKSLKLVGKPDYLIKDKNGIIPVEVKTGKTPTTPYLNHTMQLMAYCLLVEENYGNRPIGGYLKYPDKEFKIQYTDEARESVKEVVAEMLVNSESNLELHCSHKNHYLK
jgi:CRISPR-associated exonuclease Cas4